jgi:hypothetical protein
VSCSNRPEKERLAANKPITAGRDKWIRAALGMVTNLRGSLTAATNACKVYRSIAIQFSSTRGTNMLKSYDIAAGRLKHGIHNAVASLDHLKNSKTEIEYQRHRTQVLVNIGEIIAVIPMVKYYLQNAPCGTPMGPNNNLIYDDAGTISLLNDLVLSASSY